MSELELNKVNAQKLDANLLGGVNPADIINQVLSIKFNEEELAAIMTVLGIVLRAAGLQGLYDFVALLIKLEQQYIATKTTTK